MIIVRRPLGVTIIAILEGLGGAFALISGAAVLALAPFITRRMQELMPRIIPVVFLSLTGAILLALGLVSILISYGLWKGKNWARVLLMILAGIGVLLGLTSLARGSGGSVLGLAINGLLIYYFTRLHVRAFFSRQPLFQIPPPPPYTLPPTPQAYGASRFCVHCGGALTPDALYCPYCGQRV